MDGVHKNTQSERDWHRIKEERYFSTYLLIIHGKEYDQNRTVFKKMKVNLRACEK